MKVYYNEIDPGKCAWLKELMDRDVIPRGDIDSRSILDVTADDIKNYEQRHFFAGIGIWAYALRLAGAGNLKCDTGSCPCQPFSVAGQRKGTEDARHLWPAWFDLISECRPRVCLGEQTADGDGITWLDTVQSQMESIHYRFGACVLPASGFGAPHARHRTVFVADLLANTSGNKRNLRSDKTRQEAGGGLGAYLCIAGVLLADLPGIRSHQLQQSPKSEERQRDSGQERLRGVPVGIEGRGESGQLDHTQQTRLEGHRGDEHGGREPGRHDAGTAGPTTEAGAPIGSLANPNRIKQCVGELQRGRGLMQPQINAVNGFWKGADWIPCAGKVPGTVDWRPIKSSPLALVDGPSADLLPLCDYGFPLIKGAEARSLRLRGYGDGIVAPMIAEFIKAYLSTL